MIEENHARYPSFGVSGEVQMAGNSRWGQGSVDDRADLNYSLSLLSLAGVGGGPTTGSWMEMVLGRRSFLFSGTLPEPSEMTAVMKTVTVGILFRLCCFEIFILFPVRATKMSSIPA